MNKREALWRPLCPPSITIKVRLNRLLEPERREKSRLVGATREDWGCGKQHPTSDISSWEAKRVSHV